MTDVKENYRELAAEINNLRHDLSQVAHASKFAVGANRAQIAENKRQREALEARLRMAEIQLGSVSTTVTVLSDASKENTGKINNLQVEDAKDSHAVELVKNSTERDKSKWAVYGTVAVALVTSLANLILHLIQS